MSSLHPFPFSNTDDTEANISQKTSALNHKLVVTADSFSMSSFPEYGLHTTARASRSGSMLHSLKNTNSKIDEKLSQFFDNTNNIIPKDENKDDEMHNFSQRQPFQNSDYKYSYEQKLAESENETESNSNKKNTNWFSVKSRLSLTLGNILGTKNKRPMSDDKYYYSPRDLIAPTSWGDIITVSSINQIQAITVATPGIWIALRALYLIVFIYHDAQIMADGSYENSDEEMELLWDTLRLQVLKYNLTPNNILTELTWSMTQQMLSHGTAIITLLSKIPADTDFCREFPEFLLPALKQAIFHDSRNRIYHQDIIREESVVGSEICRWTRLVVAIIFAMRKGDIPSGKSKTRNKRKSINKGSVSSPDNGTSAHITLHHVAAASAVAATSTTLPSPEPKASESKLSLFSSNAPNKSNKNSINIPNISPLKRSVTNSPSTTPPTVAKESFAKTPLLANHSMPLEDTNDRLHTPNTQTSTTHVSRRHSTRASTSIKAVDDHSIVKSSVKAVDDHSIVKSSIKAVDDHSSVKSSAKGAATPPSPSPLTTSVKANVLLPNNNRNNSSKIVSNNSSSTIKLSTKRASLQPVSSSSAANHKPQNESSPLGSSEAIHPTDTASSTTTSNNTSSGSNSKEKQPKSSFKSSSMLPPLAKPTATSATDSSPDMRKSLILPTSSHGNNTRKAISYEERSARDIILCCFQDSAQIRVFQAALLFTKAVDRVDVVHLLPKNTFLSAIAQKQLHSKLHARYVVELAMATPPKLRVTVIPFSNIVTSTSNVEGTSSPPGGNSFGSFICNGNENKMKTDEFLKTCKDLKVSLVFLARKPMGMFGGVTGAAAGGAGTSNSSGYYSVLNSRHPSVDVTENIASAVSTLGLSDTSSSLTGTPVDNDSLAQQWTAGDIRRMLGYPTIVVNLSLTKSTWMLGGVLSYVAAIGSLRDDYVYKLATQLVRPCDSLLLLHITNSDYLEAVELGDQVYEKYRDAPFELRIMECPTLLPVDASDSNSSKDRIFQLSESLVDSVNAMKPTYLIMGAGDTTIANTATTTTTTTALSSTSFIDTNSGTSNSSSNSKLNGQTLSEHGELHSSNVTASTTETMGEENVMDPAINSNNNSGRNNSTSRLTSSLVDILLDHSKAKFSIILARKDV